MRRILRPELLLTALLALLALALCKENDEEVEEYPDWQNKNEQYFTNKYNMVKQQIASGNTSWKIIKAYGKPADVDGFTGSATDYILVKVLEEGTGSGCPLFTDTVRCHYRGQLIASTTHVDSSDPELGIVFDRSWNTDTYSPATSTPSKLAVSSLVDGFSTALQHMHIGDHWLVYMPHQLGYGSLVHNDIPAYSTMVFDMSLAAYYHPGKPVPDWQTPESFVWDAE